MRCSLTGPACTNDASYWTEVEDNIIAFACIVCTEGMIALDVPAETFTSLPVPGASRKKPPKGLAP